MATLKILRSAIVACALAILSVICYRSALQVFEKSELQSRPNPQSGTQLNGS